MSLLANLTTDSDKAVLELAKALNLTEGQLDELREQLRIEAGAISQEAFEDIIDETRQALNKSQDEGTPYEEAIGVAVLLLLSRWGRDKGVRNWLITMQNSINQFAAGRQLVQQRDGTVYEYWLYDAILDPQTTQICRSYNGTIKHRSDPWWTGRYPPNHFGCRSGVRALTAEQAVARGITLNPSNVLPAAGFED